MLSQLVQKWCRILLVIALVFLLYASLKALEYRAHINDFLYKYRYLQKNLVMQNVYRENNNKLPEKKERRKRIVVFGTQLVVKWQLEDELNDFEIINRGITGQRIDGLMLRFRQDVIELKPDFVIIELASFHIRSHFDVELTKDYIENMVDLCQYNKIIPIFTTMIVPEKMYKEIPYEKTVKEIRYFNNWLLKYCQKNNLKICDFNNILSGESSHIKEEFRTNEWLPNRKGYRLLSQAIKEIINQSEVR